MALHLFGWHGVALLEKRSVLCEGNLFIEPWEALEYLCGYEQDTPKCIICTCTKIGYAISLARRWTSNKCQCSQLNMSRMTGIHASVDP
jgi:hypothetical protein